MSLFRGSAINLLFRVVGVLFGLALTWMTARLGAEERGIYSIFTLVAQIFITVFAGVGSALTFRMSRHGESPSRYLPTILCAGTALGGVFALCLLVISRIWPSPPYVQLSMLAVAAPVLLITPYVNGVHLGRGAMWPLNFNNLAPSFACVVVLFLLAAFSPPIQLNEVLLVWSLTQVVAALLALVSVRGERILGPATFVSLKSLLPFAGEIGLTNLIGLLNYRADLLLVQFMKGLSAVGVYSVAVAIAEMLWFVSSSVTLSAYSRIGKEEDRASAQFVLRIVHLNLFLLLLAAPLLGAMAYFLLPFFFSETYRESVTPLLILLPGTLLYGAASTVSAFFTNRLGRPDIPGKIALVSLTINVAGSLILLPLWGIVGAALASSTAYALSILFAFYLFVRHSHLTWRDVFFVNARVFSLDILRFFFRGNRQK